MVIGMNAQQVARFCFDGTSGDQETVDSVGADRYFIKNHFNRPEFISGIHQQALRLDGYSTWIESSSFQLPTITNTLSIEMWYATEAFSPKGAAFVYQMNNSGGYALYLDPFGKIFFEFFADGKKYTLQSYNKIKKYTWNYIVAYIDLPNRIAKVLVNGEFFCQWQLDVHQNINLVDDVFYVGRHAATDEYDGYPLRVLNGAIDELVFSKQIVSDDEILAEYMRSKDSIPDLTIDAQLRHQGDFIRPQYHPMPNTSWANENYGMTYYKGKYHMFFQKNPNFPSLYFMHWGHLSSPDLVQWKEEIIPIAPEEGFESFGNWSGTTVTNDDGEPVIIYTGVDGAKAGIGIATMLDDNLLRWEKPDSNPLISSPPSSYYHMDFRDPYVWKQGAYYYMVVGSGLQNNGGGILFSYRSTDLENWVAIDPIYKRTDVNITGVFWEMPAIFPINSSDYLLCVTPLPANKAQSIYWIGSFENEKFIPYDEKPKYIEFISGNLLSPAFGRDADGALIYSGIIPESRSVEDQKAAGWRHTFSLPRELRLLDDGKTLGQIPHPNLARLRKDTIQFTHREVIKNDKFNIPEISGQQLELEFMVQASSDGIFQMQFLKNEDEQEYTAVRVDMALGKIAMDKRWSNLGTNDRIYKSGVYPLSSNNQVYFRIFIDHSTVEVFIDNISVFSFRTYPSRTASDKVDFIVESGDVTINSFKGYHLKSKDEMMGVEVYKSENLPGSFPLYLSPLYSEKSDDIFSVFPNPCSEILHIRKFTEQALSWNLYDIQGYIVLCGLDGEIDVSALRGGVYFIEIKNSVKNELHKIVIA
jgi:beta-fructofuranosidase